MEAFLSHSRKDKELVNRIYKTCSRAKITPNIAEFEEIGTRSLTAEDIVKMIHRSRLFFLFMTPNVMNSVYTQNWVNFELGCAYGAKTRPAQVFKDIYVFEPFDQIQFPIPYLDYYVLIDPNQDPHWQFIEKMFSEERIYWSRIFPLLWGQRPSDQVGIRVICRDCGSEYTLLSRVESWLCPTCRREVKLGSRYLKT
jgi:hypothetical protein